MALVTLDGAPLYLYFIQTNGLVEAGWFWQLFTSIVVAPPDLIGVFDVVFNAIAFYWLDGLFSFAYSGRQYYAVFMATAVAGNVFSLVNGPGEASFGASGGIFGLLAGVISFDIATNKRVDPSLIAWFLGVFLVSSFLIASVDWVAHLGGALVGLALGYAAGISRGTSD